MITGLVGTVNLKLPVLLTVRTALVPVSGLYSVICDAADPSVSVSVCVPVLSFHTASQKVPSDFSISTVLSFADSV